MQHSCFCEINHEKAMPPVFPPIFSLLHLSGTLSRFFGLVTKVTVQRQQPGAENQKRQVRPHPPSFSHADRIHNVENARWRGCDIMLCQGQTCPLAVDYCFNLSLLKLISWQIQSSRCGEVDQLVGRRS